MLYFAGTVSHFQRYSWQHFFFVRQFSIPYQNALVVQYISKQPDVNYLEIALSVEDKFEQFSRTTA